MEGEDTAEVVKSAFGSMEGSVSVQLAQEGGSRDNYLVKGEDSEGLFEVVRRTKDFELARKLLITQWPGVFIPSIRCQSSSSAIPETIQEATERKRANLEAFLAWIMHIPCLYHCRTMRLFIFTGPNYDKTLGDANPPSYQSIAEDYIRSFPTFAQEVEIDHSSEIQKQLNLLKLAQTHTSEMKKLGKELSSLFVNFGDSSERLNSCFETYESEVISECVSGKSGNYRPIFKRIARLPSQNPYLEVIIGVRDEELQLEAMLEAVQAYNSLKSELERLESKRFSTSKDLEKLQTGGFTLISLLSLQSKSATILELEADIRWVLST